MGRSRTPSARPAGTAPSPPEFPRSPNSRRAAPLTASAESDIIGRCMCGRPSRTGCARRRPGSKGRIQDDEASHDCRRGCPGHGGGGGSAFRFAGLVMAVRRLGRPVGRRSGLLGRPLRLPVPWVRLSLPWIRLRLSLPRLRLPLLGTSLRLSLRGGAGPVQERFRIVSGAGFPSCGRGFAPPVVFLARRRTGH